MSTPSPIVARLLEALRAHGCDPKCTGDGWTARCPAHEDHTPSLSVGTGSDGRALLMCHAGCATAEVIAELGLTMKDLMPSGQEHARAEHLTVRVPEIQTARSCRHGFGDGDKDRPRSAMYGSAHEAIAALEIKRGPRTGLWRYLDAAGEVVGMILRWDGRNGSKTFLPISRYGDGWKLCGMPSPRPLYQLPEILAGGMDDPVYVTEGEKAADAVRASGLIATTSPHGSKSAKKADWSSLAGRDVIILPDHDEPGEKYADAVLGLAKAAGARSVRVVRLVDQWTDLPKGGDAADALQLAGGDAGSFRSHLEAIVERELHAQTTTQTDAMRFTPFPIDVFPDPVREYVDAAARSIGCDPCFVALPMLAGLASAIGNTRRIKLKRAWTEPAIVWCAVVGESGTAKSPAQELALRPVKRRQSQMVRAYADAKKAYEVESEVWGAKQAAWKKAVARGDAGDPPDEPSPPHCPRTWTDDTTTEALISLLIENPRGLLMARDELAGWFNFDRYTSGKGGGDVAKWLEMYGGRELSVDRKGSGTQIVPQASVSIAGGIQPGILHKALGREHRENGLAARLLFAMPPRKPKVWTDTDVTAETEHSLNAVFDRLCDLEPETHADGESKPDLLSLTPGGHQVWVQFVNEHNQEQSALSGDQAAAWSKLECYAARFALVLHLTRVAANDPTIADEDAVDETSISLGVVLVRWFARESERVYAWLSADEETRERNHLCEWIAGRRGAVTVNELTKSMRRFRGDREGARAALAGLVAAGMGSWDRVATGTKGGRPPERFRLYPQRVPVSPVTETTDTSS